MHCGASERVWSLRATDIDLDRVGEGRISFAEGDGHVIAAGKARIRLVEAVSYGQFRAGGTRTGPSLKYQNSDPPQVEAKCLTSRVVCLAAVMTVGLSGRSAGSTRKTRTGVLAGAPDCVVCAGAEALSEVEITATRIERNTASMLSLVVAVPQVRPDGGPPFRAASQPSSTHCGLPSGLGGFSPLRGQPLGERNRPICPWNVSA